MNPVTRSGSQPAAAATESSEPRVYRRTWPESSSWVPRASDGGHGDQQASAAGRDAPQFAQRSKIVVDVLEHVEADHEVEGVGLHRQRRVERALHHSPDAASARGRDT